MFGNRPALTETNELPFKKNMHIYIMLVTSLNLEIKNEIIVY